MNIAEKMARAMVTMFIIKIRTDNMEGKYKHIGFYDDPLSRRNKRFGFYGYGEYTNGGEIGVGLDISLSKLAPHTGEEIIKLADIYMNEYLSSNNFELLTQSDLDEFTT